MNKGHDAFEQRTSDTASNGPTLKCREVSPTPLEDDEGSEEGGGVSDCESCVQRLAASVVASNQGKGSCATWTCASSTRRRSDSSGDHVLDRLVRRIAKRPEQAVTVRSRARRPVLRIV